MTQQILALVLVEAVAAAPQSPRLPVPPSSALQADGAVAWWRFYPRITDPSARDFLTKALEAGQAWLGPPSIPIRRVRLCSSFPKVRSEGLRSGFRLTELNDAATGSFTIYLSARPGETAFHGQLAHETFHLFTPQARDLYIEGLNTLLAEKLLRRHGVPWKPWMDHFRRGGDPLYAACYGLMKELDLAIGPDAVRTIARYRTIQCGVHRRLGRGLQQPDGRSREEAVDIDRWLASLNPDQRRAARRVILRWYSHIERWRWKTHPDYAFQRPSDC